MYNYNFPYVWVILKQNRAHFPHITKNVLEITKIYDTLNLSTMGEIKSSHFPHSTEIRYKKKDAQFLKNMRFSSFWWVCD